MSERRAQAPGLSPADPAPLGQSRLGGSLENYYRFHARIYDATRWSFLFGRTAILDLAAASRPEPARILEIGCGTGRNLDLLARRFPGAEITGVDISAAMLERARIRTAACGSRVRLRRQAYLAPLDPGRGFDLVLCSYALSMFNPGFAEAIGAARADLSGTGVFAFVDFYATRWRWFARWMAANHVRMDGHLRPRLLERFGAVADEVRPAYGGIWTYHLFVGGLHR